MCYENASGAVGTPQDFARARSAVTLQWNGMNSILYAKLKVPVWGFVGKTRGQPVFYDRKKPSYDPGNLRDDPNNPKVFFIGGNYQLCIPNLTPSHIEAFKG